jgi:enoyl-CoA hydratase/carnithine racemase
MAEGLPTLTVDGGVAIIQLNRPALHNRVEPEDLTELNRLMSAIEADPAVRCLVLTATGKSFSSGFNIGKLNGNDGDNGGDGSFERTADRLERFTLPTICALNGGVYGGSTDLALACDFRIGVEGMSMFMPAARLGLHYYAGGMRRYVARLGLGAAKRLFLTCARQDTADLLRIGYLDEAVPAERLMPRVLELAALLAANAPIAVQGMKRCLNDIARGEPDFALIADYQKRSRQSADLAEGRAAWLEKRTPVFTGH